MSDIVTTSEHDGVAVVMLANPPVNALSHQLRTDLAVAARSIEADPRLAAAVLICDGNTFVAGADIKEFGKPAQAPTLIDVIDIIEQASKPWIAAIHGTALGGGLELAMGCHYRVAARHAKLGLPEVKLGLIPGAGGTIRLPRLIAMAAAVNMICTGKPVPAEQAHARGLLDALTDDSLLDFALTFATGCKSRSVPDPVANRQIVDPIGTSDAEELIEGVRRRSRGQLAPVVAAETVFAGADMSVDEAMKLVRQNFQKLREGEQSAALRYIFFAERSVPKSATSQSIEPRPHQIIGVIGGGTMGASISATILVAGRSVILIERDAVASEAATAAIKTILADSRHRGLLTPDQQEAASARLSAETDYAALATADMVIEAVFEDMAVKIAVFEQLDKFASADAVLLSNTSYLDLNELAASTRHPSRVLGLHFFSPAHVMKLVEVIPTEAVAPEALATTFALAKSLGKIAVPAGVCDGFIGNRVMSAYRRVGEYLIEDGALPHEVDAAMRSYGFPMGLFEMQDLAGLDIGFAMRERRSKTREPSERYVDIADKLYAAHRMGRKSGAGYYRYPDGKTAERDPWVEALIEAESTRKSIVRKTYRDDDIMSALLDAMRAESEAILNEGIARTEEAIDVVMVNGFGFPRWRGGPMFSRRQHRKQTKEE